MRDVYWLLIAPAKQVSNQRFSGKEPSDALVSEGFGEHVENLEKSKVAEFFQV